jgi:hypothetical protein
VGLPLGLPAVLLLGKCSSYLMKTEQQNNKETTRTVMSFVDRQRLKTTTHKTQWKTGYLDNPPPDHTRTKDKTKELRSERDKNILYIIIEILQSSLDDSFAHS